MFTMGEEMMKQWSENWEKLMGDHLEKLVHNEKFISEMSKSIASTMTGKAFYTKALDEQMAALNLPSRTEIVKILQKLTDLEERIIDLSERFEDYVDAQTSAARKAAVKVEAEPAPAQPKKAASAEKASQPDLVAPKKAKKSKK